MDLNNVKKTIKKEELQKEFAKNKRISEEIYSRNKKLKLINAQIKALQEKAEDLTFELNILQEIKESQKSLLEVEEKIEKYIEKLKAKSELNIWVNQLTSKLKHNASSVISIKNATYSGNIVINSNSEKNFYRVDFSLIISPLLLNLVKEYKYKYQNVFDIKIAKEGKVLFSEEACGTYIESLKEKYRDFFNEEKPPLIKEFKNLDSNSYNKYKALDFIKYNDAVLDGFTTIESTLVKNTEEEIPF